jgi:hypothetical protein
VTSSHFVERIMYVVDDSRVEVEGRQ